MKLKRENLKLKSGIQIVIREAEVSDALKLNALKRAYIKHTSALPLTLDEYPDDVDNETNLIQAYRNSPNSVLLIAESDSELIGNIDVTGSMRLKMAHTGMIGMGIKEKWRNQGLGTALIKCAIKWANNNAEIKLLWLDVYSANELGLNLYKNTGFKVSGIIQDFFKEGEDYADKVQMFQQVGN